MDHAENSVSNGVGTELGRQFAPEVDAVRAQLRELNDSFVEIAKARPVTTLLVAVASGFVLGKLVARL